MDINNVVNIVSENKDSIIEISIPDEYNLCESNEQLDVSIGHIMN